MLNLVIGDKQIFEDVKGKIVKAQWRDIAPTYENLCTTTPVTNVIALNGRLSDLPTRSHTLEEYIYYANNSNFCICRCTPCDEIYDEFNAFIPQEEEDDEKIQLLMKFFSIKNPTSRIILSNCRYC